MSITAKSLIPEHFNNRGVGMTLTIVYSLSRIHKKGGLTNIPDRFIIANLSNITQV